MTFNYSSYLNKMGQNHKLKALLCILLNKTEQNLTICAKKSIKSSKLFVD